MTSADNSPIKRPLPPEIEDMYRQGNITAEEIESMLTFRQALMQAAPQAREGFQDRLAERLQVAVERQPYPTRRLRLHKRFTVRTALVIMVVLTLGVGAVMAVNAILRQFIGHDAGLKASITAITLNQSQTLGNYTVNLQWANADSNRLTVGFTVSGFECTAEYVNCDIAVKVFDQTGREIPMIDGRAGGGEPTRTYLYNFDLSGMTSLESISAFQLRITPYGMTNDGVDPNQPGLIRGHSVTLSEPIMLNFSLPLNGAVRVLNTPQQTLDENIILTLRRVTVSPSQTRVVVCFTPPVPERSWTTIPRLTTNGAEVVGGGATDFVSGVGETADEICNEHIYNTALFDYSGSWQLEITELVGFGSSGADQQRIKGSWIFQFQVPSASVVG